MSATTLPRIDLDKYNDSLSQAHRELLSQSAKLLDYKPGKKDSLLNQLLAIDVIPFQTDAVKAYQVSKEKTGLWSGTVKWWLWMFLNVFAIALCPWLAHRLLQVEPTALGVLTVVFFFAVGISTVISLFLRSDMVGHGTRTRTEWQESNIGNLERLIPDHVLNTAIRIKQAIPNSYLTVEHLVRVYDHKVAPAPDPFLVCQVISPCREKYYVEQWDEKDLPRVE